MRVPAHRGWRGSRSPRNKATKVVYVAVQREWADDALGHVKIGRFDVASQEWTFASYPLDDVEPSDGDWVGLSQLTLLQDGRLALLERANQLRLEARLEKIYVVDPAAVEFPPYGDTLPIVGKELMHDIIPGPGDVVRGLGVNHLAAERLMMAS